MTDTDFFNLDLSRLNIQPNPAHYLQFFLSEHRLAG